MTNENGRSMVEMLGVLAIIGVLSIGGIAGYTMAMNKYKANEIMAAASQCMIMARSANAGEGGTVTCANVGVSNANVTSAAYNSTTDTVTVTITDPGEDICNALKGISSNVTNCTTIVFS